MLKSCFTGTIEILVVTRNTPFNYLPIEVDCWIADPDEVYIRAKIVSAGDKCTVESAKGVSSPLTKVHSSFNPNLDPFLRVLPSRSKPENLHSINFCLVLAMFRLNYNFLISFPSVQLSPKHRSDDLGSRHKLCINISCVRICVCA